MTNLFDSCLPIALAVLATVLGAFALSGCMSEETASRLLVEPERYLVPEIATASQANIARQHELEGLMTKAGSGPAARSQAAWRMPRNIINCAAAALRRLDHLPAKNCSAAPGGPAPGAGALRIGTF
jgi:aminoglycoside phosphotransferase